MAIPLQIQLFDAFEGTQEGIHSIILPDIFSSGGSKNLTIDKFGRATKVMGYSKQNSSAVVTNTGANATRLRGLFHYKKTAGGSTSRVEFGVFDDATAHWELRTSTDAGVTWTFQYDAGVGSINQIPDFAQFGDTLYITNGKVVPRKSTDGTSITAVGLTQSPQPTATVSGSVGNLLGTYLYKLVSILSDGTRQYGSLASTAVVVQTGQVSLAWTQDANVSVVGYEVYRTSGTGSVFYFTSYVNGRATVAFTDNVTDLTILGNRIMEEHGDTPPTTYFVESHKQRVWWLRTDANPTRGYFSDPSLGESVLSTFNFIDFSDAETAGDVITGAIGNFEGQLVVFTERAVWMVSGTGQVIGNLVDWTRIRTNAQIGSVSHRSAVRVPAGSKYADQNGKIQSTSVVTLAYFTPLGDLRIFDGDNDIVISHPVKTTVGTFNYAQRAKVFALHDTVRAEVSWVFPAGSNGEPSQAVTWNYRWGVWYARDWAFACAVAADTSTTANLLLAGEPSTAVGGFCYQLWSGNNNNGVAIPAQWMTKTLYGVMLVNYQGQPAMSLRKRWRWADFIFNTQQTATLTVEWLAGNAPDNGAALGSTRISPAAQGLLTASGDRILSVTPDHLVVSQSSTTARALLKDATGNFLHDEGIRLRVGDNASNGQWSLEAMNLAYQSLPGLERRMP